jgi:calcineurin-like phosphoesterase family protein
MNKVTLNCDVIVGVNGIKPVKFDKIIKKKIESKNAKKL